MPRRELVLGHLLLAQNDPALAEMRDSGLFYDLATLHARARGDRVQGAVSARWIEPSTVCVSYHVADRSAPNDQANPQPQPASVDEAELLRDGRESEPSGFLHPVPTVRHR